MNGTSRKFKGAFGDMAGFNRPKFRGDERIMIPEQIKRPLNFIAIIFCLVMLAGFFTGPALAQGPIEITDQSWDVAFRDHLTFAMSAKSATEIVEADLFYQVIGQIATSRNEATFIPGTSIEASFEIDQIDPSNYFPPGTELQYWWKLVDAEGNELKTEKETLIYLDDRYDWQTLENDRLTLYWYEGDDTFGESLFERANVALNTLETDAGVSLENPIKIFIYGNHQDLLGALRASAQEWTGGVAFTEYGVVVIGINPQQLNWGLNAMTHEMTHLVIHQATNNPFGDLPRWLDEGIAVYNENQEKLDDDFLPLFEQAVDDNKLMTLRTLSSPFPADPMLANLAYGQSGEVVRYIIDTYGSDKMAELLKIFAEGELYDDALMQALGVNTDQLDNEFRASFNLPPLPGTEVDPQADIATEEEASAEINIDEPETSESSQTETLSENLEQAIETIETEEPAPTAAKVAVVTEPEPEDAPQNTTAKSEPEPTPSSGLPCLAGLLPLVALGFVFIRREVWHFE